MERTKHSQCYIVLAAVTRLCVYRCLPTLLSIVGSSFRNRFPTRHKVGKGNKNPHFRIRDWSNYIALLMRRAYWAGELVEVGMSVNE